jgi:hypothetical protein
LAVVLAVLRAVRFRAVALPPLLAAALRDAAVRPEAAALGDAAVRPEAAALRDAEAGFAFAFADVFALLELLPLRFCAMRHSSSGVAADYRRNSATTGA